MGKHIPFGPTEKSGHSYCILPAGYRVGQRRFPYPFQERFHLRTGRNSQGEDVVAGEQGGASRRVREHRAKIRDPP